MEEAIKEMQVLLSTIERAMNTEKMTLRQAAKLLKELDSIAAQLRQLNRPTPSYKDSGARYNEMIKD